MSDQTYVTNYPDCDICAAGDIKSEAHYDGKTIEGPWASMCDGHFLIHGRGLGTGKGQHLIVGDKPVDSDEDIRRRVREALEAGDFDAAEEAMGDGDPADYL